MTRCQPPTSIWAYDGLLPGPLLRVRQGERLIVQVTNGLPDGTPTTVHWHGIRVPFEAQLLQNGQPAGWFYVYGPNDWNGVKRAERSSQTKLGAKDVPAAKTKRVHELIAEKEIAPVYFFLLFVAAAGFLWYEKKRHGT